MYKNCLQLLDFSEDKTKMPTLDCLGACRFDLYYRIAWRESCAEFYGKLSLTVGIAVMPSWLLNHVVN